MGGENYMRGNHKYRRWNIWLLFSARKGDYL